MVDNKYATKIGQLLIIVFLICVFLLSVIKIEDTDTWTHLSLGREIVNLSGFPDKEPFNYPSFDKPFYSPSWLFGLIFYLSYAALKLSGVILLKAAIITTVFYILLKDSLVPHKNHIISVVVLIFIVFMVRHRFVERPDIVLMLFLSFTILALNAFVYGNKKYIYFLPLIQILWVNMHPSIVLVCVPFGAFILGGILQRFINDRYKLNLPCAPTPNQLKIIGLIFLLLLTASLINPYFTKPFYAPFELTSADWWQDEIMELQSPDWKNYKSPYLLTAALIISFLINIRRPSIIHLFLVIPFVYLSFSALRFMFLLGLVGGPLIVRNVGLLNLHARAKKLIQVFLIFFVILLTTLALFEIKPSYLPGKAFGLGVNYDFFPEGALQYLDKRNITGRVFNTFQWGGYITWRDFPRRIPFVDGRGYLSEDLLETLDLARARPHVLDELHKTYGFDVALLNYPTTLESCSTAMPDFDASLSSKEWALVYWDDLSLVYLKRGEKLKDIIEHDEYRYVIPANGPYAARAKLHDKEYLSGLISELKRNIDETNSSIGYAFLGFIYNEIRLYREAIKSLSMVKDFPLGSNLFSAYQGLAFAYGRLGSYDKSLTFYKKALKLKKEASLLYNMGVIYLEKGDKKEGAEYLEDALALNKNLLSIYPKLISIYQEFDERDKLQKTMSMYKTAKIYSEGEEHFQEGLKAYLEQRYKVAVEEYKKSIEANPSNPASYNNLGYIYYDMGILNKAYEYQKRAIDLDPDFANAHYGLALIYKKWGDKKGAKRHWEEYLRLEPKGYFSRKAKEELKGL